MSKRIPKHLFKEDHFIGRPADSDDKIVQRRINILKSYPNFLDKKLTLLDIGSGNGATVYKLRHDFRACWGLDIEFQPPNDKCCYFHKGDILKDKPKEKYDRIISFETIEHLQQENLWNYYNALSDDGIMAVSVPNKWWIFETHGATIKGLNWIPWNRVPFFSWLPKRIHERYANARIYTKKRITWLLFTHGFSIYDVKYVTAPMDVLPKGKIKDLIIKLFFSKDTTKNPFKATSIIVFCGKKRK